MGMPNRGQSVFQDLFLALDRKGSCPFNGAATHGARILAPVRR